MKQWKGSFLLAASVAVSVAAGAADWGAKSTQRSLETSTYNLQLPDSMSGELGIQQCSSCKRISLHFTDRTELLVGTDKVTLRELKDFVRSAGGTLFTMVFYDLKEPTVLRVAVSGHLARPRPNR
jgi:cytochrome c peroxidase